MAQEHAATLATAGWFDQAVFGYYPYIALAVLAIGPIIRFDREPYTWRSGSSQLLRRKQLMLGSVLFHVGVLIIFGGHFVGLLTPIEVFDSIGVSHGAKQVLAIIAGGIAGATSSFGDTAILALLTAQLVLGLSTIPLSSQHLDGSEMVKFMAWAQGIFTFQPGAAAHISEVHWIFKAHLALGLTIFLVFPFTRLVHMLSAPIWYLNRRGWQLVRTRRGMADQKSRARPSRGGR